MGHNNKEKMLSESYEYSQKDIAEKMFLAVGTVASIEKKAIEKFRNIMQERGISIEDLLEN